MACTSLWKRHHYPKKGKKICKRCGYDSSCPKCGVGITNGVCPNDNHPTHTNWKDNNVNNG
jgi:hypothetical protein